MNIILIVLSIMSIVACVKHDPEPTKQVSEYDMNCTDGLTESAPSVNIRRCANKEVICYTNYQNGFQCFPRQGVTK